MKTILSLVFAASFGFAVQAQQANTVPTSMDSKPAKACCSKGSTAGCQSAAAKTRTAATPVPAQDAKACCGKDHAGASCEAKGKAKAKARKEDN